LAGLITPPLTPPKEGNRIGAIFKDISSNYLQRNSPPSEGLGEVKIVIQTNTPPLTPPKEGNRDGATVKDIFFQYPLQRISPPSEGLGEVTKNRNLKK
jgi:hypothetical protein